MANSYVDYTGNGSTTAYAIPFSYISTSHVTATVNGVSTAITVSGSTATFGSAPASSTAIRISRKSSQTSRLVDYTQPSTLTEEDLDTDSLQAFYIAQESVDTAGDALGINVADLQWTAESKRITNVANPTGDQDAATKHYLENTWLSASDKTNLTAVAAKTTEMGRLGTTDAIADMNTLGTSDVVTDMNVLGTADVVSDMNTLGTSDAVSDMNTLAAIASDITAVAADATDIGAVAGKATEIGRLGTADAVADLAILGTADVVTDMNVLGTADVVTDMNVLATADVVTDMNVLATADVVADMNVLATADVVTDMNVLATADVVTDMNVLGTADVVSDMNVLGTADVVSDMNTLAAVATDISSVASQAIGYTWSSSTTMADPGSGALRFNAAVGSTTAIAIDDLDSAGADVSPFIISWDDSTNTNKGTLLIRKGGASTTFAIFTVTGLTDNSGWSQLAVTHVASGGSFSNSDTCFVEYSRSGDSGSGSMTSFTMSDGSTTQTVADGNTQTFAAGSGLSATVSATDTITYAGTDASTSAKGVASFHSDNFAVSSGAVTIKDGGVDLTAEVTGELPTANIADNAVTLAKMAGLARGKLIYGDASGDPAALAVGSANQVLTHDGTDLAWAAGGSVGLHTIFVPAAAMRPTTSNGCEPIADLETTAGRPDITGLGFDDGSDEAAQFQVALPKAYNLGTVSYQVFWASTAADTDGVSWALQGVSVPDNSTIDLAYGTAVVIDDANQGAAEEQLVTAVSSAVTIAGTPADDDMCFFRIFRDVSDGNDTAAEDALLIGIKLFITTDAGTDA